MYIYTLADSADNWVKRNLDICAGRCAKAESANRSFPADDFKAAANLARTIQ
jgi:hypothetical protein